MKTNCKIILMEIFSQLPWFIYCFYNGILKISHIWYVSVWFFRHMIEFAISHGNITDTVYKSSSLMAT